MVAEGVGDADRQDLAQLRALRRTTSSTRRCRSIKSNPDPAARKAAAEAINKRFGEQVYNWWWSWTLWGVATQPYVNGVERNILPDGTKGIGLAFAGRHQLNEIWCDDGRASSRQPSVTVEGAWRRLTPPPPVMKSRTISAWMSRLGWVQAGLGQHPPQIDDHLDVDVLVPRPRQHLGLSAERDLQVPTVLL